MANGEDREAWQRFEVDLLRSPFAISSRPALPPGVLLKCLIAAGFSIAVAGSLVRKASAAALEPPTATEEAAAPPEYFPLPPGTVFQKVAVGSDGTAAAAPNENERLIYSNTLGINTLRFGNGQLVSDDITTTAPVGCNLTRFSFKVLGKVNPADPGGPYTVRYALYDNCPQSVPLAMRSRFVGDPAGGIIIPGTNGEIAFPDDAPRIVEHIVADPSVVPIPTNLWLGISFTRSNCGTVVGAPAMVGHSADIMDVAPGLACSAYLGGFPEQPHASFWAAMSGGENCPASYVGYKVAKASGPQFSAGANVPFLDDVKLIVNNCRMIGYEVAVRGQAFYQFDLVRDCGDPFNAPAIPGTYKTFVVTLSTQPQLQLARVAFDPPIPLNKDSLFFRFIVNNTTGGVVKAGIPPPIGTSSKDYFLVNSNGGCEPVYPPSGSTVSGVFHASITCAGSAPVGACCDQLLTDENGESVCRDVPEFNCPHYPINFMDPPLRQQWVVGLTCTDDPFPHPCGVSACCLPDDTCENLTKNDCMARVVPGEVILWQRGSYCAEGAQVCPFNACLRREGECHDVHEGVGCSDPWCCTDVCEVDPWCCHVDWDRLCVAAADELCDYSASHDHCSDARESSSALEIEADGTTFFGNTGATEDATDSGFCCNADAPGATGYGSAWFKFVATDESVQIDTCYSDLAGDSLVNVFSVSDPTSESTACQTLSLIGCGDDDGCSNSDKHSRFCVAGLTPGATYYIMLASKTPETKGTHQLELKSPCQYLVPFPSGDCNLNGHPDGCDLAAGSSFDCNANFVPDECEIADGHEHDCNTNAVPDSCDIANGAVTDCNHDTVPDECELAASPEHDCNHNTVHDACDILDGVSRDCQPNGVPDECDIAASRSMDCDSDTVPDECAPFRQTLTADPPTGGFGYSMAFAGDELLVGDPSALREDGLDAGAVHVLRNDAGLWVEHEVLTPPDSGNYSGFGTSISVNGNSALIVAWGGGPDGDRVNGDLFLFERQSDKWLPRGKLPDVYNSAYYPDMWGRAILGPDYAAAAAYSFSGFECGGVTVHLFSRAAGTWKYEGVLGGDAGFSSCSFDFAVSENHIAAMSSRALVDGVFYYDPTAHVFQRTASGWRHHVSLSSSSAQSLSCLAIRDDLLLIVGIRYPEQGGGPVTVADVYRLRQSTWTLEDELDNLQPETVGFGCPSAFFRGGLAGLAAGDRVTHCLGMVFYQRRSSGLWDNAGTFWMPVCADRPAYLTMATSPDFGAIGLSPWDTSDPPVYGTATAFALPVLDCNANGLSDSCELRDGLAEDCNHNFTPDSCDARPPGDFDFSGRVDLRDFAGLQRCFTGNNAALAPCCGIFDLGPGDGDVDLGDAAAFPATMTGP